MSERNRLANGRFLHNLDNWTASGATYSAGVGDEHYGAAVLSSGGYIEQDFSVPDVRGYTLSVSVQPVGTALTSGDVTVSVTDGDGNSVVSYSLTGDADVWTTNRRTIGLAIGTTYTLKIENAAFSGSVYVDDVWLWYVPISRVRLAMRAHARLGRLASKRGLRFATLGELTEGDYTFAVDEALRELGCINPDTGEVDIRYLETDDTGKATAIVEREMLEFLQRDYAFDVDKQDGETMERLSQRQKAIAEMLKSGAGGNDNKIITRKLVHK